ncbi:Tubulin polyglutamylase TTLL7 [Frankliniella fusca]|uniref:Tubulin polyglutamylase TTLL7 n=1 Tax=Frankliniella fusca TaxID=407009 RepID=A0AAE1HPU5_9NEOP|nr:Tubulin polyglutamylase TTLL7 [Frankliniella fusca]KAK3925242.1 Tubulin polyglutamylase TTLL7 [Frankliniella fusca]
MTANSASEASDSNSSEEEIVENGTYSASEVSAYCLLKMRERKTGPIQIIRNPH